MSLGQYRYAWVKSTVFWLLDRDRVVMMHPTVIRQRLPTRGNPVPLSTVQRAVRDLWADGKIARKWVKKDGRRFLVWGCNCTKGCEWKSDQSSTAL